MTTTYTLGDTVLVRIGSGREREAEVIADRGDRVLVLVDGSRDTVLKTRVRRVPERVVPRRVTPMMPPATEPEAAQAPYALRAVPKPPKPWRSDAYCEWVRKRECLASFYATTPCVGPTEAHHHGGPKGMGQKAPDSYCISLCLGHHREYHDTRGIAGMPTLDVIAAATQAGQLQGWCQRWSGIDADNVIVDALTAALQEER